MPPKGDALDPGAIDALRRWIESGAPMDELERQLSGASEDDQPAAAALDDIGPRMEAAGSWLRRCRWCCWRPFLLAVVVVVACKATIALVKRRTERMSSPLLQPLPQEQVIPPNESSRLPRRSFALFLAAGQQQLR